ncbi:MULTISPECIES: alpha/beta fold hydrolase [Streptomyces]|uniref:Predicted protein n=1 Tax=Streptomyces filamentosus NRRL 15998 TaxID=457431 RepID=D6ASQ9_STRFL|nr:predicted protein [Streptomyces filamentosus NRRL 15998]
MCLLHELAGRKLVQPILVAVTPMTPPDPERGALYVAGRRLSFLDFGGPGRPLLALHGHFGEGCTFTRLAGELGDSWRVVALDQRGHGRSDRCADYSRSGYVPARRMVARRARTSLVELPAGHTVPVEFAGAVRGFLDSL